MRRTAPPVAYVMAAILSLILGAIAHGFLTYAPYSSDATDAGLVFGFVGTLWTVFWLTELGEDLAQHRRRRR